ncbi:TonB-dependent siderophore receptor [Pseudomonas aeruginosa]|uniref:Ferric aerobactin receptor n=1 Tax=Pseudomonas paraeruginosa (strain DSM 24068 / PA7) TaxID=381754 RepID=A6VCC6_PSEP7|nr:MULTISPECIES: TonB-dependent receptor [Pseudomonas aeruginosa group]ABR81142.2 TonB-dependent receptor [Pseudomonas aeruginosa PA7]KSC92289.1 TonB-dependent siderophore receptor [Pseudomonas aeruginosa]KSD18905.1 TonB-dependent siderophore receptor [Pseudomonas aeruginosa]KSG48075.1 TonB-dependent siderophore receptor [Pseudomonas aeruginosa]MCW8362772.1 TonB-dependent receptor [Pseudomonas aeruginosa]
MPRSIPSRPAPLALSLSLFASFSAPTLAADPVEQQMVVIGSRAPTSISELPGTVWVIEREQLDQQTQAGVPLKEALGQLIPGLDIGSQGRTNNGQNLRGRSVLVMIDGVSLNSSRGISRQFDSIDPFNIERIEVMSGASAVYGGGATGGIINIVTRKGVGGDTRFNTELGARSGFQSHEDHDLRAAQSISGGNDLFNGRLAIAYQKNGAAYDGNGDQVLTDITQTDLQYNRSVDLMGSLGFTFANGHSLDLGLQYYDSGYDGDRGLDLGRNFDALRGRAPYSIKGGVDLDREPESKRHQFNATYHAPEVLGHDLYLQAYYRNEKMAFNPFPTIRYNNSGAINYGTSYYSASQQDTDYYGMKLALVKTWERVSLTYGVDLDREKFTSDQMLFNLPLAAASGGLVASEQAKLGRYPDIDTDSRAFFLQGSWKATDDLTLSAGVRRQSMSTDVSDFVAANQQILIANGLGKTADAVPGGSKDYDVNLVNVGAIYKLNQQQQVWANYSEGFELPDPAKYYGFGRYGAADGNGHYPLLQGVSVNDSPLDGIKTKQVELGWRHTDGALDTQVAAFYSWSDKSIKYDSKTLAVLQQDTKKRNYGFEGQATYWLDDHWQVGVNGLAIRSQEKVDGRWLKQDVTSASPSKAGAFVGWKDDQRSLRLQGVRTFNLNDEAGNKIDGYALFDLLGTQALPVGSLTAGIQNLLDKDYTTVWGQRAQVYYGGLAPAGLFDYKGRGRTYSLTYSVEF